MSGIQRISAYALLLDEEQRILLCRLAPHVKMHPAWTLPGGGIDWGEHPARAVVREVKEETGYDVEIDGNPVIDSEVFQDHPPGMHAVRLIYKGRVIGGELTHELDESTDRCEWLTREEATSLPLVELAQLGLKLAFGPS